MSCNIPKIIHQIWIGPKPPPTKFMQTWKEKHPDFEYIVWNEAEIQKRGVQFQCLNRINEIEEINGKADIIRWEILYHYGGLFLDADSICIEPFDALINKNQPFCGYEQEQARPGLVATCTLAFPKNHQLPGMAIQWIKQNPVSIRQTGKMAWQNVGPGLITRLIQTNIFKDIVIYPSYWFLPKHFTGIQYMGHSKVYSYQEWSSTRRNYDIINTIDLEEQYKEPKEWVSVLISSYNTKNEYIVECLESIKEQQGCFGMEIIWINDGSDDNYTVFLEKTLDEYEKAMRFTKIIYKKWDDNMGLAYRLHEGVLLCNHEIIIRMDSDDIMKSDRIIKQLHFMKHNPEYVICGSNVHYIKENNIIGQTNMQEHLIWDEYKKNPSNWIMCHPTLCYKKSAVLEVGNYNKNNKLGAPKNKQLPHLGEDLELELKILKRFGKIYNIPECLLYYRIHPGQVTSIDSEFRKKMNNNINRFIHNFITV